MAKFRAKRGIHVSYSRQGYIYFVSRNYDQLPKGQQEKLRALCREAGGEYERALFEFVTTDNGAESVCMKYFLSRSTLERAVRKYYESFPDRL